MRKQHSIPTFYPVTLPCDSHVFDKLWNFYLLCNCCHCLDWEPMSCEPSLLQASLLTLGLLPASSPSAPSLFWAGTGWWGLPLHIALAWTSLTIGAFGFALVTNGQRTALPTMFVQSCLYKRALTKRGVGKWD